MLNKQLAQWGAIRTHQWAQWIRLSE